MKTYLNAANLINKLGKLSVKFRCIWGQHYIRIPFKIHAGNGELSGQVPDALNIWNFKRFIHFEHRNYLFDLDKERDREKMFISTVQIGVGAEFWLQELAFTGPSEVGRGSL